STPLSENLVHLILAPAGCVTVSDSASCSPCRSDRATAGLCADHLCTPPSRKGVFYPSAKPLASKGRFPRIHASRKEYLLGARCQWLPPTAVRPQPERLSVGLETDNR